MGLFSFQGNARGFEPQGLEHGSVPAHSRFHHVLTRYQIHLPTPYNCPVFLRLYALRTQLAERAPTSLGFVLDTPWPEWHSTSCTRRYLSWIEGLTTNQDVTGSNPVRRTTNFRSPFRGSFHMHWMCRPKAWPQAPPMPRLTDRARRPHSSTRHSHTAPEPCRTGP